MGVRADYKWLEQNCPKLHELRMKYLFGLEESVGSLTLLGASTDPTAIRLLADLLARFRAGDRDVTMEIRGDYVSFTRYKNQEECLEEEADHEDE